MKRTFLLLLFLCSGLLWAVEPDDFLCELNLSPRPQAIAKLIHTVLQDGLIKESRIRDYIEHGKSPLRAIPSRPGALSYKELFAELAGGLTPIERDQLLPALKKVVDESESRKQTVHRVREDTRDFIAPKVIRRMQYPESLSQEGELVSGTYEGRPVFTARFKYPNEIAWKFLLFDPFNPKAEDQVVPLNSGSTWSGSDAKAVFQLNGKTILASFNDASFFEIEERREIPQKQLGLESYPGLPFQLHQAELVESPAGTIVYGASHDGIYKVNISLPQGPPDLLLPGTFTLVRRQTVGNRDFMVFVSDENKIFVLDLNLGGKPVEIVDVGKGKIVEQIHIFHDQGGYFLFYNSFLNRNPRDWSLQVVDLETKVVKPFSEIYSPRSEAPLVFRGGIPYVIFFSDSGLVEANLRTLKSKTVMDSSGGESVFLAPLQWKGIEHYIFSSDSRVSVLNSQDHAIYQSRPQISTQRKIIPFEYKGHSYLMVGTEGLPYLMSVSGSPPP